MRAPLQETSVERRTAQPRAASLTRERGVWRWFLILLFALHGLVHLLGFAAAWGWGETQLSPTPAIPGGVTAGSPLALTLGALWLVALAMFVGAAGLLVLGMRWRLVALGAALLSLLLCVAWWSDAYVGAIIDAAILVGLAVQTLVAQMRRTQGGVK